MAEFQPEVPEPVISQPEIVPTIDVGAIFEDTVRITTIVHYEDGGGVVRIGDRLLEIGDIFHFDHGDTIYPFRLHSLVGHSAFFVCASWRAELAVSDTP